MEPNVAIKRKMQPSAFRFMPVEIIVPFRGETTRVAKLLDSIIKTVTLNRYLVTLVDDCSEREDFYKQIESAKIAGVRCLRLDEQKGFGAAVNYALKHPKKFRSVPEGINWVCIMQSDVVVEDMNWLYQMGNAICGMRSEDVKMIGPRCDNPGVESQLLKAERHDPIKDTVLPEEEYLPLYCALCHRDLFKHVGHLHEYQFPCYEGEEFAYRMRKKRFNQAVCGTTWVHHEGGATLKNLTIKEQEILRKIKEQVEG
jgi:GT2 family glycosyltransferase